MSYSRAARFLSRLFIHPSPAARVWSPDPDANDDMSSRARASHAAGQGATALTCAYALMCTAFGDPIAWTLSFSCIWLFGMAASQAAMRAGHMRFSLAALALGGWISSATIQWFTGALHSPAMALHVIVIFLGGALGGLGGAALLLVPTLLNASAMWIVQAHPDLALPLLSTPRLWRPFFEQLFIISMACMAIWATIMRFSHAASLASSQREKARSSKRSLETLFLLSPVPMALTESAIDPVDGSRHAIVCNDAFCTTLSIDKSNPALTTGSLNRIWARQDELATLRADLANHGNLDKRLIHLLADDGRELACLVSTARAHWQDRPAILWTFLNVTAKRRLLAELEALHSHLELLVFDKAAELALARSELERSEALASLGEMVAGVAHEINTPLGNALLAASTLHEPARKLMNMCAGEALSRSELAKGAQRILEAASITISNLERAGDIIRNFKQLSTDPTSLPRQKCIVAPILEESLKAMGLALAARNASSELRIESAAASAACNIHAGALAQICSIMVSNAAFHGFAGHPPDGGWTFLISASLAPGGLLRIDFIDNGIGMDERSASKVFEPFFTSKPGKGGTGLGSAIAWNLAREALGGSLFLASHDHGCVFRLEIPLAEDVLALPAFPVLAR